MLFRLVRPMPRKGSFRHQFVQRIPADVKAQAVGTQLLIPPGKETIPVTDAGVADSVLDAICGHAERTEGSKYGRVALKVQRDAMPRFPRFGV